MLTLILFTIDLRGLHVYIMATTLDVIFFAMLCII